MRIVKSDIYVLGDYANHLKGLTDADRTSRFGYNASAYAIDQLMLKMAYAPHAHELWQAIDGNTTVGWGHMAQDNESWELAVSVESNHQRRGIGDKLIAEMLSWAKFHRLPEVYMHCIEDNKVIQHLASKHNLKTRERGGGERTAAIEVPAPSLFEAYDQLVKEQTDIMNAMAELRGRLFKLWTAQNKL